MDQEQIKYRLEKEEKQKAFDAITSMANYYHDEENVNQLKLDMINYLFGGDRNIVGYSIDIEYIPYGEIRLKLHFEKTKEEQILHFLDLKYGGISNITIDINFIRSFYNEVMFLKDKYEWEE